MIKDRRVIIGFIVSVIVNLALVAYIIGNHLASHRSETSIDPSYALPVLVRSLSPERVEALMPDYVKQLRADVRPYYNRLRNAQARMYRELSKKEVNQEALERAIDDYWLTRHSAQSIADSIFVEMVIQLSLDERTELLRTGRQTRARYEEWRRSRTRRDDSRNEEFERSPPDTNTTQEQSVDP